MRLLARLTGLSSKIYIAFLVAAGVPMLVAGLAGIYLSLDALRQEALGHLEQEVRSRVVGMGHFFDQLASELLYLSGSSLLLDVAGPATTVEGRLSAQARARLENDYAAFARAYPYIYQVRFVDTSGREIVRIDRRDDQPVVVPRYELQNKSDRYYIHDALALEAGQVYMSPLDLNVEHGRVELPERPVVRFATPVVDSGGNRLGLLIVNLHAAYILGQIEEMAGGRGGVAYLFDRSGFYLSRSAEASGSESFTMRSAEALATFLPRPLLARIVGGQRGTEVLDDWIVAHAPIAVSQTLAKRSDSSMAWSVALAFPKNRLFEALFNLYFLYGLLALSLLITAVGGFMLSRHLLRPLTLLRAETEEIARGNFTHRVEIRGKDEIADLGACFNAMAGRLEHLYQAQERRKNELEAEVRARTLDLERERGQLVTVIANTADGIVSVGVDGRVELANVAAWRYLCGVGEGLVGRSIREFCADWDEYAAKASSRTVAWNFDLRQNGRTLSLGIAPVPSAGYPVEFILVLRDVTDERRVQDERRELDRHMFQMEKMSALGEIAMGLAHEIGNPLAGIKSLVQLLLEDECSDRQREYLSLAEDEINRLSTFLRTFNGFAAPQEMHPVACRLEQALDDIFLWTRREATACGVTIMYAPCCERVPELWADPWQLKQMLLNLVINAIHAMPDGGSISIGMCSGARLSDPERGDVPAVRFCVRDSGIGIAPEVLSRIFDPFFTTRPDGSGLGLAVARKIVQQHGAAIRVDSTPGHGTCFELTWPVAPGADATPMESAGSLCQRGAQHV
ncbi:MAG: HAMP domain-containing protein [Rhodocyclales bacterium]|nr:HAMP domain-containing protein [Rhodocyclales bacterium]